MLSVSLMIPVVPAFANGPNDARSAMAPNRSMPATDEELAFMEELAENPIRGYKDYEIDVTLPNDNEKYVLNGTKDNDSSFYINIMTLGMKYCHLYTWGYGYIYGYGTYWHDLTYNGVATANKTGEYEIYNLVYENLPGSSTRLSMYKPWQADNGGSNKIYGLTSADCWGWYPPLGP